MAHPLLTPVTSSSVASYGYFRLGSEAQGHKTLFVEFLSGKVYRYEVPESVCENIETTTSFGQFVNQMKTMYTGTEIGDPDLTNCIQAATASTATSPPQKAKRQKKPMLTKSILLAMPQLEYFF